MVAIAPLEPAAPNGPRASDWPGDPADTASGWYAPLRTMGISVRILAAYGVGVCRRPDERRPHPAQHPRLYWRYPVWEEDGLPLTWRLAAVDGEHPRAEWDGRAHPELVYEPLSIRAGQPLVVCGDVASVWVLASLSIPAVCFLCGPSAQIPGRALGQIIAAEPSSCLVVDNGTPCLPQGPRAVASALRRRGCAAAYARLAWPTEVWRQADLTMTHLATRTRRTQQSSSEHAVRVLEALGALCRERTTCRRQLGELDLQAERSTPSAEGRRANEASDAL